MVRAPATQVRRPRARPRWGDLRSARFEGCVPGPAEWTCQSRRGIRLKGEGLKRGRGGRAIYAESALLYENTAIYAVWCTLVAVDAVYARSSLDTEGSLRHGTQTAWGFVGTQQGVAGLTPGPSLFFYPRRRRQLRAQCCRCGRAGFATHREHTCCALSVSIGVSCHGLS